MIETTRLRIKDWPKIEENPGEKFGSTLFLPLGNDRKGEGGFRTKDHFKKSYESKPLVSIITVVFNGEGHLEEAIRSVLSQTYDNIEYIIIDGGSTDGTRDIIRRYEDRIDYWVSEKDGGIYDAMNKALRLVTGEIVGILNADDRYVPDAVETSVNAIINAHADYSIGAIRKIPSQKIFIPIEPLEEGKVYQGMMYPHIAAFIKREVYKQVGLFDTQYKIAADMDMALRIHLNNFKAVSTEKIMALFTEGGASSFSHAKKENMHIAIAHGKSEMTAYFAYILQLFKFYADRLLPGVVSQKLRAWKKYL